MSTTKLNDWLQILASVGVIVGLLIVAYEIKQNTDLAHAEFWQRNYDMWMQISAADLETDIEEVFVKSIAEPESLTPEEKVEFSSWMVMLVSIYDNTAAANEFGIETATGLITELEARIYFSSEISRSWFEANKYWIRAQNVEVIDQVIATTPTATEWGQIEELMFEKRSTGARTDP